MTAKKGAAKKSARKESGKTAEEQAAKLVGKDFLASDVDVSRDREDGQKGKFAKRVAGGRLVEDLDEDLTDDELDTLREQGVVRPATIADARASIARDAAEETRGVTREMNAKRNEIRTSYDQERSAVRSKHDSARDEELRKLDVAEAEELADVDKEAAEKAGGASAPSDAT